MPPKGDLLTELGLPNDRPNRSCNHERSARGAKVEVKKKERLQLPAGNIYNLSDHQLQILGLGSDWQGLFTLVLIIYVLPF